jgi:hypothetical protein
MTLLPTIATVRSGKAPTLREASRPAYTRARENRPVALGRGVSGVWATDLRLDASGVASARFSVD